MKLVGCVYIELSVRIGAHRHFCWAGTTTRCHSSAEAERHRDIIANSSVFLIGHEHRMCTCTKLKLL